MVGVDNGYDYDSATPNYLLNSIRNDDPRLGMILVKPPDPNCGGTVRLLACVPGTANGFGNVRLWWTGAPSGVQAPGTSLVEYATGTDIDASALGTGCAFYVQGSSASSVARDVTIVLEYDPDPGSFDLCKTMRDTVRVTVLQPALSVAGQDDAQKAQDPGLVMSVNDGYEQADDPGIPNPPADNQRYDMLRDSDQALIIDDDVVEITKLFVRPVQDLFLYDADLKGDIQLQQASGSGKVRIFAINGVGAGKQSQMIFDSGGEPVSLVEYLKPGGANSSFNRFFISGIAAGDVELHLAYTLNGSPVAWDVLKVNVIKAQWLDENDNPADIIMLSPQPETSSSSASGRALRIRALGDNNTEVVGPLFTIEIKDKDANAQYDIAYYTADTGPNNPANRAIAVAPGTYKVANSQLATGDTPPKAVSFQFLERTAPAEVFVPNQTGAPNGGPLITVNGQPGDHIVVRKIDEQDPQKRIKKIVTVVKAELNFGTYTDVLDQTDWANIVDPNSPQNKFVDIIAKVTGLKSAEKYLDTDHQKIWTSLPIHSFRLDADATELWPANKEPTKRNNYPLGNRKDGADLGFPPAQDVVFFSATEVDINTLLPNAANDTRKGIVCADGIPRSNRTPKNADGTDAPTAGTIPDDVEIECDTLAQTLSSTFSYAVRGVAHPLSINVINYDDEDQRKLNDAGGRRWGRPVLNPAFIAAAGVERLVITVFETGKDGGLWKQPGKPGQGLDHILFRHPADIFYITGIWASDVEHRCHGILAGDKLAVVPTTSDQTALSQLEDYSFVVLTDAWATNTTLKWYALNSCFSLTDFPTGTLNGYKQVVETCHLHGVLGYDIYGWSGSDLSQNWVTFGNDGMSIRDAWLKAMSVYANGTMHYAKAISRKGPTADLDLGGAEKWSSLNEVRPPTGDVDGWTTEVKGGR